MKSTVAIFVGSASDVETIQSASTVLKELEISSRIFALSAHRSPREALDQLKACEDEGTQVIIAGAGLAAHLPGVLAAHTVLPVIGVPISAGPLKGQDALLSIVQMPPGVPVGSVGIDNAKNAGLLAAAILGASDREIRNRLLAYRDQMRKKVLDKNATIQ